MTTNGGADDQSTGFDESSAMKAGLFVADVSPLDTAAMVMEFGVAVTVATHTVYTKIMS